MNYYYFRYYNQWWRSGFGGSCMSLWKRGNYTVKAPLHISNLADGIMAALDQPESKGVIYEAYG